MWVCFCCSVNSTQLHAVIDAGARSLGQIGAACGAGTDCGRCKRTIQAMLDTPRPATPDPPRTPWRRARSTHRSSP